MKKYLIKLKNSIVYFYLKCWLFVLNMAIKPVSLMYRHMLWVLNVNPLQLSIWQMPHDMLVEKLTEAINLSSNKRGLASLDTSGNKTWKQLNKYMDEKYTEQDLNQQAFDIKEDALVSELDPELLKKVFEEHEQNAEEIEMVSGINDIPARNLSEIVNSNRFHNNEELQNGLKTLLEFSKKINDLNKKDK